MNGVKNLADRAIYN